MIKGGGGASGGGGLPAVGRWSAGGGGRGANGWQGDGYPALLFPASDITGGNWIAVEDTVTPPYYNPTGGALYPTLLAEDSTHLFTMLATALTCVLGLNGAVKPNNGIVNVRLLMKCYTAFSGSHILNVTVTASNGDGYAGSANIVGINPFVGFPWSEIVIALDTNSPSSSGNPPNRLSMTVAATSGYLFVDKVSVGKA
jgi:hypothetical protein